MDKNDGWWDPIIMDKHGFTPLAIAARRGDVEEVHRLLTAGAAVEVKPAPKCRCNCEWNHRVRNNILGYFYLHLGYQRWCIVIAFFPPVQYH